MSIERMSDAVDFRPGLNPAFLARVREKQKKERLRQEEREKLERFYASERREMEAARARVEAERRAALRDAVAAMDRVHELERKVQTERQTVEAERETIEAERARLMADRERLRASLVVTPADPDFQKTKTTLARVVERISRATGVNRISLMGTGKGSCRVVLARQAVMYWAVRRTGLSMSAIGRIIKRDHSTIIHGRDTYVVKRKAMGRTLRPLGRNAKTDARYNQDGAKCEPNHSD